MSARLMSKKREKAFSDLTGLHIKESRRIGEALTEALREFEEEEEKKKERNLGGSVKLSLSITEALAEIEKAKTKINGSPFNPI